MLASNFSWISDRLQNCHLAPTGNIANDWRIGLGQVPWLCWLWPIVLAIHWRVASRRSQGCWTLAHQELQSCLGLLGIFPFSSCTWSCCLSLAICRIISRVQDLGLDAVLGSPVGHSCNDQWFLGKWWYCPRSCEQWWVQRRGCWSEGLKTKCAHFHGCLITSGRTREEAEEPSCCFSQVQWTQSERKEWCDWQCYQ